MQNIYVSVVEELAKTNVCTGRSIDMLGWVSKAISDMSLIFSHQEFYTFDTPVPLP